MMIKVNIKIAIVRFYKFLRLDSLKRCNSDMFLCLFNNFKNCLLEKELIG